MGSSCLIDDLSNSDLCKNTDMFDLNELAKCYNKTFESVINKHTPLRTKIVVNRPYAPWFNIEVKPAKREQRRAEQKWRRTKQPDDFEVHKSKKNCKEFGMKRARKNFHLDVVLEHRSDQRKLLNVAKTLFSLKNYLNFPSYEDQNILANDIGEFFVQKIGTFEVNLNCQLQILTTLFKTNLLHIECLF